MLFVGSPAYFSNFFGFGNNTPGYKDEKNKFNRVNIRRFTATPGFYYEFDKKHVINLSGSFDVFKVSNPDGRNRFINEFYSDSHNVFDTKLFFDLNVGYEIDRKFRGFISSAKFSMNSGWTFNVFDAGKNFPYMKGEAGVNFRLTDRLTLATLLRGKAIFTDKYEFYQSATTELRGFRDNRFIGRQSFYQYSDLRFDMGQLENPFTPLKYGVFTGVDYGRVWYPQEDSRKWHSSYGGGFWLTLFKNFTGKFSYFASADTGRFQFELGMGF